MHRPQGRGQVPLPYGRAVRLGQEQLPEGGACYPEASGPDPSGKEPVRAFVHECNCMPRITVNNFIQGKAPKGTPNPYKLVDESSQNLECSMYTQNQF